jgi:hypothetical protein
MRRCPLSNAHDQVEYVLTPRGLDLKPVIVALTQWGDIWVRPGPIEFRDKSDGRRVRLQLRRDGDDARIAPADVVVGLRPSRTQSGIPGTQRLSDMGDHGAALVSSS